MLTKELIDKFYEDVDKLGLERPVAALSTKMKKSKGMVSEYLNKQKTPSENFIKLFYETFYSGSTNVPHGTSFAAPLSTKEIAKDDYLQDLISTLKQHNSFLQDLVKSNLTGLSETQRILLAQVKAGLQFEAKILGAGNKKKEAEALADLNRLVAANLLGEQPADSKAGQHM